MNDKLINIQNPSLLKVTRVRDWSICFSYDGQNYLIHGCSECGEGSWQNLHKRELNKYGKYTLEYIGNHRGDDQVKYDYFNSKTGKPLVYSHINKEEFAYKLTKNGFATGVYKCMVENENFKLERLRTQLKELACQERVIQAEIKKLMNKGLY